MWWKLGRWDTVDDMLAALGPRDIVRARAAYETIPLDDGWKEADTISRAFELEMAKYMTAKAGKTRLNTSSLSKPGDYIPRVKVKRKPVIVNNASIDYYHLMIQRQYGYG